MYVSFHITYETLYYHGFCGKSFQKKYIVVRTSERNSISSPSFQNDSFCEGYSWNCALEYTFKGEKAFGTVTLGCLK